MMKVSFPVAMPQIKLKTLSVKAPRIHLWIQNRIVYIDA